MRLPIAVLAAIALITPVAAQDESAPQQTMAEQNVDCAIWASYQTAVATDERVKNAFAIALAWYIGLYEGEAGKPIDDAMAARTLELDDDAVDALTPSCLSRFGAFGERLKSLSARIGAQEQ